MKKLAILLAATLCTHASFAHKPAVKDSLSLEQRAVVDQIYNNGNTPLYKEIKKAVNKKTQELAEAEKAEARKAENYKENLIVLIKNSVLMQSAQSLQKIKDENPKEAQAYKVYAEALLDEVDSYLKSRGVEALESLQQNLNVRFQTGKDFKDNTAKGRDAFDTYDKTQNIYGESAYDSYLDNDVVNNMRLVLYLSNHTAFSVSKINKWQNAFVNRYYLHLVNIDRVIQDTYDIGNNAYYATDTYSSTVVTYNMDEDNKYFDKKITDNLKKNK